MLSSSQQSNRKTGIDILGDVPWGTHSCLFYKTKEDLLDILVPYFKAGLENNEFCIWITSDPLSEKEAEDALMNVLPNFDRYLQKEQIQILPHSQWYLQNGKVNLDRVLNSWIDKLNQALSAGFAGMRVTGNITWLEKVDWENYCDYERQVNNVIGKYQMIAICTYSLDRCGATEVVDVIDGHRYALIRREGKWEVIKSSEQVVKERTAALTKINRQLKLKIKEEEQAKATLQVIAEQLKRNSLILKIMTGQMKDMVYYKDKDFRYIFSSKPHCEKILKCSQKECIGKTDIEIATVNRERGHRQDFGEICKNSDLETKKAGKPCVFTEEGFIDDEFICLEVYKTPIYDKDEFAGIVGCSRDIAERKRAEGILIAKSQMVAQIAHEINNPLAGIKNSFLLIKDAIPESHPYYKYVSLIDKEINRASNIVKQMFDLYRPNEIIPKEFIVYDTICELAMLLGGICRERNVIISTDNIDKSAVVVLHENLLRQALFNIIKNAVEASPVGGEVEIAATIADNTLTLTVADQGSGIPVQVHSRLFEPSFTTKNGPKMSGLGLGLSISKNIIEGMGGTIQFKSEENEGTVFSIIIPIKQPERGQK